MKPNKRGVKKKRPKSRFAKVDFAGWIKKLSGFFREAPFLSSFILTFLLATLSLVLFRPYFIYNDDYIILLLLKGVGISQAPSELVQHVNVLLGLFLKSLYTYFPKFQWYSAFQVCSLFLSFWAILAAMQMRPHCLFKTLLFLLSTVAFFFYFFSMLQWTYTASIAAMGAFFLLAGLWDENNAAHRKKIFTLASILTLISLMLRLDAFLLVVLLTCPSIAYLAWKRKITPMRLSLIRLLTVWLVLGFGAVGYHHYAYQQDAAWADFMKLERLRAKLTEYRNPVYEEKTKPIFDSIGWTYDDNYLLSGYCYMDKGIYNQEKFEKLIDYFPRFVLNKHSDTSFSAIFSHQTVQVATVFFLVFLFFLPFRVLRLAAINVLWVFLLLLFLMLYLKSPERVCLPLFLFAMYMNLFFAVPGERESTRQKAEKLMGFKAGLFLLAPLLVFSLVFIRDIQRIQTQNKMNTKILKESLRDLNPQEDQLYVNHLSSFNLESIPAFDDFEMFRHFNLVQLSWNQRSPITEAMIGRFGVKVLFKDMVDNPNVFLMVYSEEADLNVRGFLGALGNQIKERYSLEVNYETVKKYPAFQVLRIHSVKAAS
jgi:hypothetical protein